jgi:hypothetical protein
VPDATVPVPDATVPVPDEAEDDEAEDDEAEDDEAEDVAELGLAEVPGSAGAPALPLAGELGDPALRLAEAGAEAPDDVDNAEHPAVSTPAASSGTASNLLFTESPVIGRRLINISYDGLAASGVGFGFPFPRCGQVAQSPDGALGSPRLICRPRAPL